MFPISLWAELSFSTSYPHLRRFACAFILLAGILFSVQSYAQSSPPNIVRVEYYIDTDPGLGNGLPVSITPGTNLSNLVISIDPASLSEGVHRLYTRALDANGAWSLTNTLLFYKPYANGANQNPAPPGNITTVEYYIDTDPGLGQATQVSINPGADLTGLIISIDPSTITEGVHRLYTRARNSQGNWSLTNTILFYKPFGSGTNPPPNPLTNITQVEYYIDSDPGFGQATPVSISPNTDLSGVVISVDPSTLAEGVHRLYTRARNTSGAWSLTNTLLFYKPFGNGTIPPPIPPANISRLEYYIDTDPGFGQGTSVPLPTGTDISQLTVSIDQTGLTAGSHKLFLRAQDANGRWSLTNKQDFTVPAAFDQTLTITSQPPAALCRNSVFSVNYSTTGTYHIANVFTIQLSDASGSFASPVAIGSITSSTSGSISCTVPANTVGGSGYRIRVVSSDPALTSVDNGQNLTIGLTANLTCPQNISVSAQAGQCSAIVNFSATGDGPFVYSHQPGSLFPVGQTTVTVSTTNDCGTTSCNFTITVVDDISPIALCKNASVTLSPAGTASLDALSVNNSSTDNCTIASVSVQPNSFNTNHIGANTVVFTVTDGAGNESTCTAVVTVVGTPAGALDFDGINDYVSLANGPVLGNVFTQEVWVYPTSGVDNQYHSILGNESILADYNRPPSLYVFNGSQVHFGFGDGTAWNSFTTPLSTITPNTWSHLALSFDGTNYILYVNGTAVFTTNAAAGKTPNAIPVSSIGHNTDFFKGKLDEVRLWNRALSAAEIQQRMSCGLTEPANGLLAYYQFNHGINGGSNTGITTLSDQSGNNRVGSLMNFNLAGTSSNWVTGQVSAICIEPLTVEVTKTNSSCGLANGSASAAPNGGTAPYSYSWSNGANTPSISNLAVGTYTVTITDATNQAVFGQAVITNTNSITLGYSTANGFINSLVNPVSGGPETPFRFEVLYTNAQGQLPASSYPRLLLDAEGNNLFTDPNDRVFFMQEKDPSDQDVTDGKEYYYLTNFLPESSNWKATIQAQSADGCSSSFGPMNGPVVISAADLTIFANDITFSNVRPEISSPLTVNAIIHNYSGKDAYNFKVRLKNQFNGEIYTDIVVPFLSGHVLSNYIKVSWTITTPNEPAWCPMQVIIDPEQVLVEPNELDNQAIRPFTNGRFTLPGDIKITAKSNPTTAGIGSVLSICGHAEYRNTAVTLLDPSCAGATVTATIEETNQVFTGYTNENGDYCLNIQGALTPGVYHAKLFITDYTLEGDTTTSFTLVVPEPCTGPSLSVQVNLSPSTVILNDVYTTTTFILEGQSITGTVIVSNSGKETSTPTTLRISLPDGTPVPGPFSIGALQPGQSLTITLPTMSFAYAVGTHIQASLDYNEHNQKCHSANIQHIRSIWVLPGLPDISPEPGGTWTADICKFQSVGFRVRNLGGVPTGNFNARLTVTRNNVIVHTQNQTVSSISPLDIVSISYNYTPDQIGNYAFRIDCDIPDEVLELEENNNAATSMVNMVQCLPDLYVSGCGQMDVKPADPASSGIITIYAKIFNSGLAAAAGPIHTNFNVAGTIYPAPVFNGTLAPGSSFEVSVIVPAPPHGNNELVVTTDITGQVTEYSDNNNSASAKLCWDFSLINNPCSSIIPLILSNYYLNQAVQFRTGLSNAGLYEATHVRVKFELSGPGINGWQELGNVSNYSDNTCSCPMLVTLPGNYLLTQLGNYQIRMTVDDGNEYTECNEGNNVLIVPFTVNMPVPNYLVRSEHIAPSLLNPDLDEEITIDLTYRNEGASGTDMMEFFVQMNNTPLDSMQVNALQAYRFTTVHMPTSWSSNLRGVHVIRAIIDHDEEIVESNELDNEATRAIVVGQAPNLKFNSFTISNAYPSAGDQVTVQASIKNGGHAGCYAVYQLYYVTNAGDEVVIRQQSIAVDSLGTISINSPWIVTDPTTVLRGRILNANPVEYDETDNSASVEIGAMVIAGSETPATCPTATNGQARIAITGGRAPFFIQWSNGQTGESIAIGPGLYYATITDAEGVIGMDSVTVTAASDDCYRPMIYTLAGNGEGGFSGDSSTAGLAQISNPAGIAVDSAGSVYFADRGNNRVRRISKTGVITTVAGTGLAGYSGDGGPATEAQLNAPSGIAVDRQGNVYIADYINWRIRKVNTEGIITTVAGNGNFGFSGDGGPATNASIWAAWGIQVDSIGNLYIADGNNHRVRKVDTYGIITTIAGNGTGGYSGDGGLATTAQLNEPVGTTFDHEGRLLIVDLANSRIRRINTDGTITTVAGNGVTGFSGDGGPATAASLYHPYSAAVDSAGNLFIADGDNNRVRKIDLGGIITTYAGTGNPNYNGDEIPADEANISRTTGIATDSAGNIYISDQFNERIRLIGTQQMISFYIDQDGDGYGDPALMQQSAQQPNGYVDNNEDCNDADATIHPDATETCDGIDNNCNGEIDEECPTEPKPKVLLIASEQDINWMNDVRNKLLATGKFSGVDNFQLIMGNINVPDLDVLQQYQAVLVWTNYSLSNSTDLGDNLVQYINGGGGVVTAVNSFRSDFTMTIGGAFQNNIYQVIIPDGTVNGYENATIGQVLLPAHPTIQGVNSMTAYYRKSSTNITPGSYLVANWTDGLPMIAVKDNVGPAQSKRVDLGFFPPSRDIYGGFGWDPQTDGATIMANALLYVANAQPEPTITINSATATTICTATSVVLNFTVEGNFAEGNIFTAQLSDAAGNFENPTEIGDTTSNVSGTLELIFPHTLSAGASYKVRIIASEPAVTGTAFSSNFNITPATAYYRDADMDFHGNTQDVKYSCTQPVGYVSNNLDCNDANPAIHSDAPEVCDGIDNDCNGVIDNGFIVAYYPDVDGDGYGDDRANENGQVITAGSCTPPAGYVNNDLDCNDADNTIYPDAPEVCDGKDNNCNGNSDENCPVAGLSQFRTKSSGNWNDPTIWETSTNGTSWVNTPLSPSYHYAAINIRASHVVTVTAPIEVDEVTVDANGSLVLNASLKLHDGPGAYELIVTGSLEIKTNGILKSPSGPSTLLVEMKGLMIWDGGMLDSVTVDIRSTGMMNATGNDKILRESGLRNSGNMNWYAGNLEFNDSYIENNATFNYLNNTAVNFFRSNSAPGGTMAVVWNGNSGNTTARIIKANPGNISYNIQFTNHGILKGEGLFHFFATNDNYGILSPGNNIGTFTSNSNKLIGTNSNLAIEINSAAGPGTGNDLLALTTNVTLGGKLTITETGTVPFGEYTLLTSTGTITGSFALTEMPQNYTVVYQANKVLVQKALPIHLYRTMASGNFTDPSIWQRSNDGTNWVPAVVVPTNTDSTISIRTGHVITINGSLAPIDDVLVETGAELIAASTFVLNNGLPYYDLVVNGTLTLNNGTFSQAAGSARMVINGTLNWNGGINRISTYINPSGIVNIQGSDKIQNNALISEGTINWNQSNIQLDDSYFIIVGGLLNTSNTVSIALNSLGGNSYVTINNGAGLVKSGTGKLSFGVPVTNLGFIKGKGSISFNNNFTNNGRLEPGLSTGILTLNKNPFTSNSNLVIETQSAAGAGIGHDQIMITDPVVLSGKLTVQELTMIPSGSYVIVQAAAGISGAFSQLDLPSGYSVSYTATSVVLTRGYIFHTVKSAEWSDISAWEISDDGINWLAPLNIPSYFDSTIEVRAGHIISTTSGVPVMDQVVIRNGGKLLVTGSFNINNGLDQYDMKVEGSLEMVTGTISATGGSARIQVLNTLNWNGGTITTPVYVQSTGQVNMAGGTKTIGNNFTSEGTINWYGGDLALNNAVLISSGTFNYLSSSSVNMIDAGGGSYMTILASGIFIKQAASTPIFGVRLNNYGLVRGSGEITFNGIFLNEGSIEPGLSIGQLKLNKTPFTSNSHLKIEMLNGGIAGTGYDQLYIPSPITLGGKLTVTETGSVPDGVYNIVLSDGKISGNFAQAILPPGYVLKINNNIAQLTKTTASINIIATATLTEGNAGLTEMKFPVKLSAARSGTVTVQYTTVNGTALAGSDYVSTSGTLAFLPGQIVDTIRVPVTGDNVYEPDQTFTVQLSNPSFAQLGTASSIATIRNDDRLPAVRIDDEQVYENSGTAMARIYLTNPSEMTVSLQYYTANGTATAPADYTAITPTSIFFTPGIVERHVPVSIVQDLLTENDEYFSVRLSNAVNGTLAANQGGDNRGEVTIRDALVTRNIPITVEPEVKSLVISASPNPSQGLFRITVMSNTKEEPINLFITDINGRLVESRRALSNGQMLIVGDNYRTGIYFVVLEQGILRRTLQLVKQ